MTMTSTDTARRTQTPPLQGRGKGWGLSAERLAELHARAREMRRNPTEPELRLWRNLSGKRLGGFKFRRQEVMPPRIFDFFCPSARLVVEVDGHTHDPVTDAMADRRLAERGYKVLRFTNEDVMSNMDGVIFAILQALECAESAHPNPSPEGEGLEKAEARK